jgi:RNA recognition motif. (a.k.a. RRM, RBD, or RNP domain)
LKTAFSPFGTITAACVIKDRPEGKSLGYAFVTYLRHCDAEKAIKTMDKRTIMGRQIIVQFRTGKSTFESRADTARRARAHAAAPSRSPDPRDSTPSPTAPTKKASAPAQPSAAAASVAPATQQKSGLPPKEKSALPPQGAERTTSPRPGPAPAPATAVAPECAGIGELRDAGRRGLERFSPLTQLTEKQRAFLVGKLLGLMTDPGAATGDPAMLQSLALVVSTLNAPT